MSQESKNSVTGLINLIAVEQRSKLLWMSITANLPSTICMLFCFNLLIYVVKYQGR